MRLVVLGGTAASHYHSRRLQDGRIGEPWGLSDSPACCPVGARSTKQDETGVQEIAILHNISGHLPLVFAEMRCFGRQVSTFSSPVADFVDTCRRAAGENAVDVPESGTSTAKRADFAVDLHKNGTSTALEIQLPRIMR